MRKDKLFLIITALTYSIFLGSMVYIWPKFKELWIFLQIICLPAIYYIGYEILMAKERSNLSKEIGIVGIYADELERENIQMKKELSMFKNKNERNK